MRKAFLVFFIVLFLFALLFPFETTIVPAWNVTVVDEKGVPYIEQRVDEIWKHYSLELEEGENSEERWTDGSGQVKFPERTIRVSLLGRIVRVALTTTKTLFHGSTGISAYLFITGPQGVKTFNYEPNKPTPDRVVLPRYPQTDLKQD